MTDRELRKLNRKELLRLLQEQREDCEQAKEHIAHLRRENVELMESLARIGETLEQQRRELESAKAERAGMDAEYLAMTQELAAVREGRDRLEEQVHEIAEKFVRLKNLLLEKEEKLKAAEAKLAGQERTTRSMQERQSAGPGSFRT